MSAQTASTFTGAIVREATRVITGHSPRLNQTFMATRTSQVLPAVPMVLKTIAFLIYQSNLKTKEVI